MKDIIIVGGGASGMIAAVAAAESGAHVTLLEKNEKLGKKIYITGKGRCNITNMCDTADFFDHIFENPRFAYSAVYNLTQPMLLDELAKGGLHTKTERGERVFPVSDRASDVTKALTVLLDRHGVDVVLNENIKSVICEDGRVCGVAAAGGKRYRADAVILCCGGKSYPSTGSDGSGYTLAEKCGHTLVATAPALVGLETREKWPGELAGLTLKNIEVSLYSGGKFVASQFGELLFTHKGVSGPTVLSLSCRGDFHGDAHLLVDLKPALTEEKLDERLQRDFSEAGSKTFKNSLLKLEPASLAAKLVDLSGIEPEKKINQITSAERKEIVSLLKSLKMTISASGGYAEAVISRGGINVREIDPSSMASKICPGLYFGGEIIAVHGYTGGFNLQLA